MRLGLLRGPMLVNDATVGAVVLGCIALAVEAACTLSAMARARSFALGFPPVLPRKHERDEPK
jgi:hypothetical protein